ncbi:MAG TPA: right-handed parallel beta-helix repeat-containing protein [Pyrinomonadaceae bacterium]|jgi:hypothetical protein
MFILAATSFAQAQATRTWVSGVGDDVNPCSRTAPCKTFAGAISKTAASGEISVLDPGGFGALTITKSITVNGEGTLAGVLNALTTGFIVNATSTDTVNIRYVSINAPGNGTDGIRILQAKNVNIEEVSIAGNTGEGIEINETSDVNVLIRNSTIRNNTTTGVLVATSGGFAKVVLDRVSITGSGVGVRGRSGSRISMLGCTVSGNTTGVQAEAQTGGSLAVINIEHSQITQNAGVGVQAGGGLAVTLSIARISDCQITNNGGAGVTEGANGQVDTYQNNEIIGNTPDGCVNCNPAVFN